MYFQFLSVFVRFQNLHFDPHETLPPCEWTIPHSSRDRTTIARNMSRPTLPCPRKWDILRDSTWECLSRKTLHKQYTVVFKKTNEQTKNLSLFLLHLQPEPSTEVEDPHEHWHKYTYRQVNRVFVEVESYLGPNRTRR